LSEEDVTVEEDYSPIEEMEEEDDYEDGGGGATAAGGFQVDETLLLVITGLLLFSFSLRRETCFIINCLF
jgi:hypothetical protein